MLFSTVTSLAQFSLLSGLQSLLFFSPVFLLGTLIRCYLKQKRLVCELCFALRSASRQVKLFRGWEKSCKRVDASKHKHSSQVPRNRFPSRRGQVSLFWTDFAGIKALKVFFHKIRTFCKPLLPRRRKELCCQPVDQKKEWFSVFSDFG